MVLTCWAQVISGYRSDCLPGGWRHVRALRPILRYYSGNITAQCGRRGNGINNQHGALGSFAGSYMVGYLNGTTGSFGASYIFMAGSLLLAAVFTLLAVKGGATQLYKTSSKPCLVLQIKF